MTYQVMDDPQGSGQASALSFFVLTFGGDFNSFGEVFMG